MTRTAASVLLSLLVVLSTSCGSRSTPPKLLVIGIDGATFDLLTPWIEAGELPRLGALIDSGVSGELLSVIPPLSPPAWTTAATGVNPGRHGIFDFLRFDPDSLIAYTETAASRRVPTLWTLLSERGHRVGVLNVPMTDPPDPVEGFHVAGLPHTDQEGFAHPPGLETRLTRGGYLLDTMGGALIEGREAELEEQIVTTFRHRKRVALELGAEYPDLDLFWVVFTGTDRVQHFFWKFMDAAHPFHDPDLAPRFGDSILNLYREVDTAIGELVDQAAAQAQASKRELAVVIISDHGFFGVHRAFRPQSFLRNPPGDDPPITVSYSLETNAAMLYVPLRGRERNATLSQQEHDVIVGDIKQRMTTAVDPQNLVSPVVFGARREEIFDGRYVDKAPDLLFLAREPYYLVNEEGDKEPFGSPGFSFSGHHGIRGMLVAWGPMFGQGRLEGRQSLIDIAPTLMYLAGETVPGYMEGTVLTRLLTPEYLSQNPVKRDQSEARETGSRDLDPVRMIPYLQ